MAESPAFYPPDEFAFTEALRRHWRTIRAEYLAVRAEAVDWAERKLYDEGWKVLALYQFPHGEVIPENATRCPETARLVAEHFPTHGAAGFSILLPGTEIRPHQGYQGPFLRCHLGLVVPDGDCAIEVDCQTRRWSEGELLVLDDRLLHRAWNRTNSERAVLLVDFVPARGP